MKQERSFASLPFSKTQEFVQAAYDNAFIDSMPLDPIRLDREKPHAIIKKSAYDVQFGTCLIRDREYPLICSPINGKPGTDDYAKNRNTHIALKYLFSGMYLDAVGREEGITRERVRQIVNRYLDRLWKTSSSDLKNQYPRRQLSTKKDNISNPFREGEKVTEASQIRLAFREGATTAQLLQDYGAKSVGIVRRGLIKRGLPAPELAQRIKAIIPEILDPNTSNERLCVLIKEFDSRRLVQQYSRGENPLLTGISKIMLKAWGNKNLRNTREAQRLLKKKGLPEMDAKGAQSNRMDYRFTFKRCEEEAVEALKEAPDNFKGSSIRLAYGDLPEGEKPPNTTMLTGSQKKSHRRVSPILKELGINRRDTARVLSATPVPIFRYKKNGLFVAAKNAELLRKHLASTTQRSL